MKPHSFRRRLAVTRLPESMRAVSAPGLAMLASIPWRRLDLARLLYADHLFHRGRYADARQIYTRVKEEPWAGVASLMSDWIDYKTGIYDGGWPRYPNKGIGPDIPPAELTSGPVVVGEQDRPIELVSRLGLRPWEDGTMSGGRPLIWFDWKASLGGEVLAARIVRAYLQKIGTNAVLAIDPRLTGVISRNFPTCEVVSKTDNIAPMAATVSGYLLARDVLRRVVQSEADFAAISERPFVAAPAAIPPGASDRPNVAFTWKTTNVAQGTYRNIHPQSLAECFEGLNIRFHSAQHGASAVERDTFRRVLGDDVSFDTIDPSAPLDEFASELVAMDLVVTIDNSVLHIAGAFGCPTIGLISIPSYWAWPVSGHESRWYRSVRLLHQQQPGRWDPVHGELRALLLEVAI